MTTGLFGQAIIEPMPSKQIPLFHEPVAVAAPELPGTTAADRKIARKFNAAATPMLRRSPAVLPVPKPLPDAIRRGAFGSNDNDRPVRPGPAEVRAITEFHAEKLLAILNWSRDGIADGEKSHFAYMAAIQMYVDDFGIHAANRLDSYVQHQFKGGR